MFILIILKLKATSGGVVIASRQVWELVRKFLILNILIKMKVPWVKIVLFFMVKNVKKGLAVKMKADALLIKNKINLSDIEAIRPALTSYIPAAILPYLEFNQEGWSSEIRRLSILFVNLGINLSDSKTTQGLERIQVVIETVQKVMYSNQGSLNKLLMDDKGSTLIVVFGLSPMAHQDDPIRAVLAAVSLVKELRKIHCSCSIGITTGVVFAGVVGTSGSRREYSILGY